MECNDWNASKKFFAEQRTVRPSTRTLPGQREALSAKPLLKQTKSIVTGVCGL